MSLDLVLAWLAHYRYFVIFPLAVVEGPIIMILSGFLVSLGTLGFFTTYIILVIGDLTGDSLYYALGRFPGLKLAPAVIAKLGLTHHHIARLDYHFKNHPKKIFSFGKISQGFGAAPLFVAGLVKFPFTKFMMYNSVITLVKSFLLLLVGYYFGRAYHSLGRYLDYWALASAVAFIVLYILILRYLRPHFDDENTPRH